MFCKILKFQGKSINVRDVIYTKRINASLALVNNQPPMHKCVGGAERVKKVKSVNKDFETDDIKGKKNNSTYISCV